MEGPDWPSRGGRGVKEAAHWAGGGVWLGVAPSPPSALPLLPPPARFSTRFQKGDVAVTVVESPKASGDGPVCKKRGSHKMEVLVH